MTGVVVLPVVVHDGVESVGNSDDGGALEFLSNRPLDECISVHVDGGSCFVQHQHLRLAQQSPSQAHELSLSHTKMGIKISAMCSLPSPPT